MLAAATAGRAEPSTNAWEDRGALRGAFGNMTFVSRWEPERGIHLKIQNKDGASEAVMEVSRAAARIRAFSETGEAVALLEPSCFRPEAMPAEKRDRVGVLIKFRNEAWSVFLDTNLVAVLPPGLARPGLVQEPPGEFAPEERYRVGFQKTEPFYFHDDFMMAPDETNTLASWDIQAGEWYLHTANDDAEAEGKVARGSKVLKPEYSPNFYSVEGRGTNAIMVAGHPFYDRYECEAAVQTAPGEMGLIFLQENPHRYFAFTLEVRNDSSREGILKLWRRSSAADIHPRMLRAASTVMTEGQWVMLKVRLSENRIRCYMDNQLIMDVSEPLPAGGRFGLYADSDDGVLFDDVTARSNEDLDLHTVQQIRFHAIGGRGGFLDRGWSLFRRGSSEELSPPFSRRAQWLAIGAVSHGGHVFSAAFDSGGAGEFGVLAAYRGENEPHYRLVCRQEGETESFRIERVTGERCTVLEQFKTMASGKKAPVVLMADAATPGEMRFYRNRTLVLVHPTAESLDGASGVYAGPGTRVRVSDLTYIRAREDVYRSKFEKNRIFATDPYMRHWSSPEGEWVPDSTGRVWHKSDFFGRFEFEIPLVNGAELHLGVEEGKTNGTLIVALESGQMLLLGADRYPNRAQPLIAAAFASLQAPGTNLTPCRLAYEGHWLWATVGTNVLFKHGLKRPMRGVRVRADGALTNHLGACFAYRYNVKDYLFTEAPWEWTINGGRWEVINRFQCQPQWSHMNGESADGMAAIWTKYRFSGDFCVELYAGTRHQWYQRVGDFNMSVMSRDTTPSQGYTVTCTGWDYDHSQRYTTFYRDGIVIDRSDKYLAPRNREGNRRLRIEPVVQAGRDVHGAWYYLKLRRIGKRLEYYFDNELVFSRDDPAQLDNGLVGIWTFMNSMMVARVKVAAADIRPRERAVTDLNPATVRPGTRSAVAGGASATVAWTNPVPPTAVGTWPLAAFQPAFWMPHDRVSQPRCEWERYPDEGWGCTVSSTLGSGSQLLACRLPPLPLRSVAGWRFQMKRTPGSQINFHYSIGRVDGNGEFVPQQRCFFRISGPGFTEGEFLRCGEKDVPPSPRERGGWRDARWTPIDVWVPASGVVSPGQDADLLIRIEGFGLLQPSYELQGLSGNGPGEAYAVRGFHAVRLGTPVDLFASASNVTQRWVFSDRDSKAVLGSASTASEAGEWLKRYEKPGLNELDVMLERDGEKIVGALAWAKPSSRPELKCEWNQDQSDTIVLSLANPYPDPRLAEATMTVNGVPVTLRDAAPGRRTALVPRALVGQGGTSTLFRVSVRLRGEDYPFALDSRDNPGQEPPALVGLEGLTPFFENFESQESKRLVADDGRRMVLRKNAARRGMREAIRGADRARLRGGLWGPSPEGRVTIRQADPVQGYYLEVRNRENGQRLRTAFRAELSLARHPVFSFRYRGPEMAQVSLGLGDTAFARLVEDYSQALPVPFAKDLILDGRWHTWRGMVGDVVRPDPLDTQALVVPRIAFGSYSSVDQTGRFTEWNLDDLVLGPAVSAAEQLVFTPRYFDADGVEAVFMAVCPIPPDGSEPSGMVWKRIQNEQKAVPDIAGLGDGAYLLLLKALDKTGAESEITEIPFVLDRRPLGTRFAFEKSDDPLSNGTFLRVGFVREGGAPLALESLKVKWNGEVRPLGRHLSRMLREPDQDILCLNWPYIFRTDLDKMELQAQADMVISDIQDGAGNRTPDLVIPVPRDVASDRTPPALLPTGYPTNVLKVTSWEGRRDPPTYFEMARPVGLSIVAKAGEEPYLTLKSHGRDQTLRLPIPDGKWALAQYPFISLRIRRDIPPKDKTTVDLAFELSNGQTYVLPLNRNPKEKMDVAPPKPVSWASNRWAALTFNVAELLKARMPEAEFKSVRVNGVRVTRTDAGGHDTLDIQSLHIYGPWTAADTVAMDGYDASGVEGVTVNGTRRLDQRKVAPASLEPDADGWVMLQLRDKAGNLSFPIRVPLGRP